MGSGVAFLDVDGDGWQDLLFVNSMNWPGPAGRRRRCRRSIATTATARSPTSRARPAWRCRCTAWASPPADFDNDGDTDIYVTCARPQSAVQQHWAAASSRDVTARAGVGDPGFSTSAAWFDYDRDGRLDLFVANYVQWSIETDLYCTLDGRNKSYCTPESYKGQSPTLYRNKGDGTFEDVTRKAGLYDPAAKSLGVALIDYDNDGRLDLFVANDTQPNRLYRNKGDGTFADVGDDGRRRVQRGRRRARRHGRRRGRLRRLGPPEPGHRQLLQRDDGALLERRERPVHRRRAGVDRSARPRC